MGGFFCCLVSPWAADASEGAFHMLEVALLLYSSVFLRVLMLLKLLLGCQMFLMFGLTSPLLVLGSLPISLCFPGVHVGGAMLIMFALLGMKGSPVGVSFRFQGLYRLFRGQSYGVSSWLFSLLMLCILELTIKCRSAYWTSVGWSWWLFSL